MRKRNRKRLTECHRGHPLCGDNVYEAPSGDRSCRACRRLSDQRRRPPRRRGARVDVDRQLREREVLETAPRWVRDDPAERRKWIEENLNNPLRIR